MADSILIQGAGQIAHAQGTGKLAAAKAWTKISEDLSDKLSPIVQDRYDAWAKYSKIKLSQQGLDDDDWNSLYSELEQKRGKFIFGNAKARAEMLRDVDFLASQVTDKEGFLNNIANSGDESNDDGLSDSFKNSALGDAYLGMLNGDTKAVVGEDEKTLGYMIDSGVFAGNEASGEEVWKSLDELNAIVEDYQYDQVSSNLMGEMMNSLQVELDNRQEGEDTSFNYWNRYNAIKQNIIGKSENKDKTLRSLCEDQHIVGRTFKNDVIWSIMQGTYSQYGIDSDLAVDGTPETKMTETDATKIYKSLTQNEAMLEDYLSRYYTNHMQKNWIKAAGDRDDDGDKVINKEDPDWKHHNQLIYKGKWGGIEGEIIGAATMDVGDGDKLVLNNSGEYEYQPGGDSDSGDSEVRDLTKKPSSWPEGGVTSNITKRDENKAVKRLRDAFPREEYGFTFEAIGGYLGRDKIKITAPNKNSKEWTIDAINKIFGGPGIEGDKKTAAEIDSWMQQNSFKK